MNLADPVLSLTNIHKAFGGVVAIQDFSLDLRAGEIVALVGDNGAGKSTLVKIISGVYKPTSGAIRLDGEEVSFSDASSARSRGIEVVYQDLALADQQPVYMNMFLGRELTRPPFGLLDKKRMRRECQQLVDELDVRIPSASSTIRDLSGGQRQGIAIARATHWASKLVLLDEPTAALGVAETAKVEELVASLKKKNLAILIISHSLDQVFRLSDRICVLRRGQQIGIRETAETDKNEIVSMITGVADKTTDPGKSAGTSARSATAGL
ncbi:ATP-binding cassette domain-containing protein [Labrenzia sp. VG12]|uniref:ATP-binding cassette domain-containing protein n=1 Tax=Labrenzia sp. VG12 TaxID=2021862 RepID=UPI000B8C4666|nr:ATP-binding cassette domain-containing protein [Labrenzia sp. VG12]ASP33827.1 ABC transporter ATP-binding protein [Labrenzia sp. VG12]